MKDEERAAAVARLQEKHNAYVTVFGTADKPTTAGAIVLADLERLVGLAASARCCPMVGAHRGAMDPYGTIYNVGLQDVVKHIHKRITWSAEETQADEDP